MPQNILNIEIRYESIHQNAWYLRNNSDAIYENPNHWYVLNKSDWCIYMGCYIIWLQAFSLSAQPMHFPLSFP